jgi:isopenicillin-N N-acyltransferase like protein
MSLVIANVKGSPRDMGRAYGEALGPQIREAVSFYESIALDKGSDMARVESDLGPYVEVSEGAWPDLAAEIDGIAEGAGIDREAAWVLNCIEEVWPFESCVTMSSGSFLMHAEQWYAGHERVAVINAEPEDGPAFLSPTCVGFLPAVGMSSAGFAQGIDSLSARDDRPGIPRVLVSRRSLGANSIDEAVAAACVSGRAGGYGHTLKSNGQTVVVETTAASSHVFYDAPAHTNHYLSSNLRQVGDNPSRGSQVRLERATQMLEESEPRTLAQCVALLSDHGDGAPSTCLHGSATKGQDAEEPDPTSTTTAFGMVCDVSTGKMLVSEGRPCSSTWHELTVPNYGSARPARVG